MANESLKTDPHMIISYNEGKMITNKEYNILKRLAKNERDRILNDYELVEDSHLTQKVIEHIIRNTAYEDMSLSKREAMLANALLPDDIQIIDILTKEGFTIDHIKTIIRFRDILKNLLIHKQESTNELKEQIKIYKAVVDRLIDIFNTNFYTADSTIILNRLCELLVTKPHMFSELTIMKLKSLNK